MANTLLIRADASSQIGTGHVMRCLTLAAAAKERGITSTFLLVAPGEALESRVKSVTSDVYHLQSTPGSVEDAQELIALAQKTGATRVIVDGYHFDGAYQQALKDAGLKTLLVDDYGNRDAYLADIVLNQNLGASADLYVKKGSSATLLLGPSYALLRSEFQNLSEKKISPVATKILVTLGGADPDNRTELILDAIASMNRSDLNVTVLVGAQNPHLASVKKMKAATTVLTNVTDMARLMMETDIAIAAAGTTTWELLCAGVPFVSGTIATNQEGIAAALKKEHLAVVIGRYSEVSVKALAEAISSLLDSAELRTSLSTKGRTIVDGKGTQKVLDTLESL